jgi:hypothetical protein
MTELYATKHDALLTEFNLYVMAHPEFLNDIPDQADIVLLDPKDPEFNRYNMKYAHNARRYDDLPDHPVVYVDVGELAPAQSRLVNPWVLQQSAVAEAQADAYLSKLE